MGLAERSDFGARLRRVREDGDEQDFVVAELLVQRHDRIGLVGGAVVAGGEKQNGGGVALDVVVHGDAQALRRHEIDGAGGLADLEGALRVESAEIEISGAAKTRSEKRSMDLPHSNQTPASALLVSAACMRAVSALANFNAAVRSRRLATT